MEQPHLKKQQLTSGISPEEGNLVIVKSPVRLIVILAVAIFVVELLVMLLLMLGLAGWPAAFLDATLLRHSADSRALHVHFPSDDSA
jgi:hypothetical protein